MQLEEMRMARKAGETDEDLQRSLEQAKRKFDGLLDEVDNNDTGVVKCLLVRIDK